MRDFLEKGGNEKDIPTIRAGSIITVPLLAEDPNRPSWLKITPIRRTQLVGTVLRPILSE